MKILRETLFVNALLDCLLCEAPLSTFAPARRGAARRAVSRRWRLGERSAALGLGICALVAFHALVCSDMLGGTGGRRVHLTPLSKRAMVDPQSPFFVFANWLQATLRSVTVVHMIL